MNVKDKRTATTAHQTADAPGGTSSAASKELGGLQRRTLCVQMAELSKRHRLAQKTMLELRAAGLPAGSRDIIRVAFGTHGITLRMTDITGELLTHRPRPHAVRSAS